MRIQLAQKMKLATLLLGLSFSAASQAALVFYGNEASWNNAVGPVSGTEDFNAIPVGSSFKNTTLVANNMQIKATVGNNSIEVVSQAAAFFTIDNTPHLTSDLTGAEFLRIDFDSAVKAWSATFRGIGNDDKNTDIKLFDVNDNLLGTIVTSASNNLALGFYGFLFTENEKVAYLTIQNPTSLRDTFAIDNISYVIASDAPISNTPLPPSLALFATGLIGLAGLGRKKLS